MSMELYIVSDRALSSLDEWQRAIDAEGFLLQLMATRPIAALQGALPVIFHGQPAAFECDHRDAAEAMAYPAIIAFGHRWQHALALRWGGEIAAAAAAYMAAAAYAKATGGMVYDCEEGRIISPDRSAEIGREIAGSTAQIDAAVQAVFEAFRNKK
jgi:hypothetical protein